MINQQLTRHRSQQITLVFCLLCTYGHFSHAVKPETTIVDDIVVTANPLHQSRFDLTSPISVINEDRLMQRRTRTLGETLNGLPGISSTSFGPGASRPIIRGLDGDRIRLLQNGIGILDASSLSYDHAVPQDMLTTNRIEIVRGPAALMYGGNAIGGIINLIDGRIPRKAVKGVQGTINTSYASVDNDRAIGGSIESGNGQFTVHADAFSRRNNELRIPGYAWSIQQRRGKGSYSIPEHNHSHNTPEGQHAISEESPKGKLPNSDSRSDGGALGASWFWDHGFAGIAYSHYDANYGSVAETDVRLKTNQERLAVAAEVSQLSGPVSALTFNMAHTNYWHREQHTRITEHTPTLFKNRGYEARLEVRHAPIGVLDGVIGLQIMKNRFSAQGEEAFVPDTATRQMGLFIFESFQPTKSWTVTAGSRIEHTSIRPSASENIRFQNLPARHFTSTGVALGSRYSINDQWSFTTNAVYTERAPTFYELFADGAHVATGAFERGNAYLSKEKSTALDLGLHFQSGFTKLGMSFFYNRFHNFINLEKTGRWCHTHGAEEYCTVNAAENDLPEYAYRGVPAVFYGAEMEGAFRIWGKSPRHLDFLWTADYTYAKNRHTGQPLPRIAPFGLTGTLAYRYNDWDATFTVRHAASQHRVPIHDSPTSGYTTLALSVSRIFEINNTQWTIFVRGNNLTNEEVRYATSILRDIAPQGARGIQIGINATF